MTEIRSVKMEERTIVLLGKTGVGKSATGNTILRRDVFESHQAVNSVTKESKAEEAVINGKRIRVVDTPGLFDTEMPEEEIARELGRSVYLAREVVHAFVLVFPCRRFTEQEEEIIIRLKMVFGEEVTKHMIVLFTNGDEAGNYVIDVNIYRNKYIRSVLDHCGGRYQIINNSNPNIIQESAELLEKIERMVRENRGRCYTSEAYEQANRSTWEKFWEISQYVFKKVVTHLLIANKLNQVEGALLTTLALLVIGFFIPWQAAKWLIGPEAKIGTLAIGFQKLKV